MAKELTVLQAVPQSLTSPTKRKAEIYDDDVDAENIDPSFFSKRSKGENTSIAKPSNFILTKAPASPSPFTPISPQIHLTRPTLTPKSPAKIITTSNSMLSAPAGRSPSRKRIGLLHRRKTASPFTRVDPPNFSSAASSLPFSLGAALSGTTPLSRPAAVPSPLSIPQPTHKPSWDFEIHEDTPEETLTNLMEHGTCTLDISSDEETEARRRAEGRGKENVPPMDHESFAQAQAPPQGVETSKARSGRRRRDEDEIEVDRKVLGEVPIADLYTGDGVVVVEEDEPVVIAEEAPPAASAFDFSMEAPLSDRKGKAKAVEILDIDELMKKSEALAPEKAALLQPIERAEEGWEVWESGSAKGDE